MVAPPGNFLVTPFVVAVPGKQGSPNHYTFFKMHAGL
jgi:hypothetical protein